MEGCKIHQILSGNPGLSIRLKGANVPAI